ncbi:hypothetical protein F0562_009296 [Nyssa sinensis]|uniref:Ubiquitin carboxyl-terminal hydrolase n=1 Tax=Nyssa sinensis TaxID=561372 RepID=A0A5J4ZVK6_9ASTE|nr:hypothetical protein F0562_009296 [Nyssa sinensis]
MADSPVRTADLSTHPDGVSDPQTPYLNGSLFHRRIDFHLAKKPFTGFSNGGGDFRLETLNPSSEPQRHGSNQGSGPAAPAGKKPDRSEFLDNGLDPELSSGITLWRIGAGLENLGNTCFLNSVVQCLTYTEPLAAYLQSGKHQTSCRTAGFCALCAIQKHVRRALESTGRILAPKDLVSNLRCISRNFRNARQEDAHEYMVNLLESMHKCCLPSGVPSESPSAYEKSLVHKIFGGSLRSQVKCMQCSFCSNKFDPFLDLSLEIVKADSLYKALAHFTAKEHLDGGERQYQCQQCKQKVRALKQLTVHKAPYVLTVHLKRFGSHKLGQKIDKKVQFDPTLDLKPFVSGPYEGDLKYTLYGVLVHAGWSTHSGHYYCFVRTSSGMWYSLDDNRVVQVNERKVLEQKAYMLFYVRNRKNFVPKKPVDVVQKDKFAINAMGNKTHSNSNHSLKEAKQNGLVEKKLNGVDSSAAACHRNALVAGASNKTLIKEPSVQKSNGFVVVKCNKDSVLEPSSKLPLLKDPVKELSVRNLNGEGLPPSSPSVKGSDDTLELDNAMITTTGARINDYNDDRSTKKDLNDSISIAPNCNGLQNSITKKDPGDSVAVLPKCNEDKNTEKKDLSHSVAITLNCSGPHGSAGDVCITDKTTSEKIGGFSQEGEVHGAPIEGAVDIGQRMVNIGSIELSSLPTTTSISLNRKASDGKAPEKMKKKLLKCRVTTMHLGSNILFGASLGLRKKKHKRSKRRTLEIKNLTQEDWLDRDGIPTDLGPSTSEKTRTMSLGGSGHSRKKVVKSGSNKKDKSAAVKNVANSNGDSLMGIIDKEFRERVDHNGAMLATEKRPQKSYCFASSGNQFDIRGPNSSKDSRRDSMQNGLMSMLTRGLEETIVARWDGIELPPSQITELNGIKSVSIGYIADEWDEEYDRGKRKKVRSSKINFDGPNPFQESSDKEGKIEEGKDGPVQLWKQTIQDMMEVLWRELWPIVISYIAIISLPS